MTEQAENRPRLAWLKPRFTIRGLLWTTALVAALFPAGWFFWFLLLNASTAWGTHAVLGTAVLLAIAAAVALSRGGAARAFWGGFAAVGFVYFLLVVCNIAAGGGGGYYLFDREKLVTKQLDQWVYREYVMPKLTPLPGFAGGYAIGPGLPALEDFEQVAHSLWSLLLGCGGGLVSLVIWMTGPRRPARGADNGQP
jgi:hypothetical protein